MAVALATRSSAPAPAHAVAAPVAQTSIPAPARAPGLSSLGSGEPMRAPVRHPIERSLGADLSGVRVHHGPAAATLASQNQARAFATGPHIILGAGERSSDIALMAHESAHVIQQSRGSSSVQRSPSLGTATGALEAEAGAASVAVLSSRRFVVTGRAAAGAVQRTSWWDRARSAVGGAVSSAVGAVRSAASAVAEAAGDFLGRILDFLKDRVSAIPGYDVLGFVLGRDPVTQRPVERNARNLLRAITGLVPGGRAMFDNLERSGVIERAFTWVEGELARLQLTWAVIRGAIQTFLNTLGIGDLLRLGAVFDRIRAIFGPILQRLLSFAVAAGGRILEFIFEGALALAGGAAQRVLGLFRRIGATFRLIVNDPVGFLRNLLAAVMGGFRQFGANILDHLRTAIFEWLFGALAGAGLRMPARLDFAGIMSIVLQILGLTWDALRLRLVRIIGEPAVGVLETAFDFIRTIVTQGLGAAWQRILEFATGLIDTVIDGIKAWVARTIIGQAIARIVTMFNPVGAIINAIMTIYNTVMFVVERARQIMAFVDSVVDSIANIASGNISAAVGYVERTLARILPLVISFLARLIGLGGISGQIRSIIARIRAPIERAMDRVADWVRRTGQRFLSRALGGNPNATPQQRLDSALDEGTAAVNRLSGSAIGEAVIRPVLAAIRLRHNLQSLVPVRDGNIWSVEGVINPRGRRRSNKQVAGAGGGAGARGTTAASAFEIDWPKRPLARYAPVWLVPAAVASGREYTQAQLRAMPQAEEFRPASPRSLFGGATVGVTPNFRTTLQKTLGPAPNSRPTTPQLEAFKDLFKRHGYNRARGDSEGTTDADHVSELQMVGPSGETFSNLWPLNLSENRSSGSTLSTTQVTLADGTTRRVRDLTPTTYYFKIRSFLR